MTRRICIVLFTYAPSMDSARVGYAHQTLRSALDGIKTTAEVAVHIADDGSPREHRERLRELAGSYAHVVTVGESNSERRGYGASYNMALSTAQIGADYILPLEDDWVLKAPPLNIDHYLDALDTGMFGCIRLGYLGVTQTLLAHVVPAAGHTYWLLHPDSSEPHVFSGHPRIETVAWERSVGPWREGLNPGETEFWVAVRAARDGIVWPSTGGQFNHIGAVQARTDQSRKEEVANATENQGLHLPALRG